MAPPAGDVESRKPEPAPVVLDEILLYKADLEDLRKQIGYIDGDKVGRVAILSFRGLQLYRIAQLQAALVMKQNAVLKPPNNPSNVTPGRLEVNKEAEGEETDRLIQRYADAVRNYETLSQAIRFDKNVSYEFLGGKKEFQVHGRKKEARWDALSWIKQAHPGATVVPYGIGPLGFRELDKKRTSERAILDALRSRFYMALFGSVSLISPMLIMSLVPGLKTSLITTSVATVIFALIVVIYGTDASGKDVLAWTAAYTAVLVVFVGNSLQCAGNAA
ncbi:hypothetical protein GQ53DRAFT_839979 [Thozetella sp. PMI_491]|nr:hypothetical protein GQ53DRAFT_839979 [Thozetella sp. PMI_491]